MKKILNQTSVKRMKLKKKMKEKRRRRGKSKKKKLKKEQSLFLSYFFNFIPISFFLF